MPYRALQAILLAACLAIGAHGAPARAETLRFVMEPFPPFITDHNGRPAGPFPEVVVRACAKLRITCNLDLYPWRRAYEMAVDGAADGIVLLVRLPEREHDFHFVEPLFRSAYSIVVSRDDALSYRSPRDLDGYVVAAYGPSATSRAAEELAAGARIERLVVELDNRIVLRKVAAHRYGNRAVALVNRELGNAIIQEEGLRGIRMAGDFKPIDYTIAFSRRSVSAGRAERFAAQLRAMSRSGEIRAIAAEHGVTPAP